MTDAPAPRGPLRRALSFQGEASGRETLAWTIGAAAAVALAAAPGLAIRASRLDAHVEMDGNLFPATMEAQFFHDVATASILGACLLAALLAAPLAAALTRRRRRLGGPGWTAATYLPLHLGAAPLGWLAWETGRDIPLAIWAIACLTCLGQLVLAALRKDPPARAAEAFE